jgi:uncharacterized tellurite resistance protein B-like protein
MYYLIAFADGKCDQKEKEIGEVMVRQESLNEREFQTQLELLQTVQRESLLNDSIKELKKLDKKLQNRIVAWMCIVANADGFMSNSEWQLIYRIYHKELSLSMSEILTLQKELNVVKQLT